MRTALWLLAAALPLAAQPKLLVNAKLDTKSAAAGLEREFKALLTAQPQPAWVAYSVPTVKGGSNLSCEYVRDSFSSPGVIHLEPPDHAVIMFRVEGNQVVKLRSLSPDCEIDAGNLTVHWLTDVAPAQSIALLETFVPQREMDSNGSVTAIAVHADAAADPVLDRYIAPNQPEWLRRGAASLIGSLRGRHGAEVLRNVIANDPDETVKLAAVSGLSRNKEQAALDLLLATARNDPSSRMRSQAISGLNRKTGQAVLDALNNAASGDQDLTVRRRAVDTLATLPDDAGIPILVQLTKSSTLSESVKQGAITGLARSSSQAALDVLLATARNDNNPKMRTQAISALNRKSGAAVLETLNHAAVDDGDESVRRQAVNTLATMPDDAGVPILVQLAKNANATETLRQSALTGLARSESTAALDLLLATARSDSSPKLRSHAVSVLNRKSGQKVLDTVKQATNDPDPAIRRQAVSTLASLPDSAGIPSLIDLVKTSKDLEVRKQAMSRLQNSHDPRAQSFFSEVLK